MPVPEFPLSFPVTTTDRGARQASRLRKIYNAAEHSIGLPVDDAARYEATMLVERFKSVEEQLAGVMDQVKSVCPQKFLTTKSRYFE
ncbi:uncharacterized protein Dvar_30680 [Desulfosarcina variabilis str. Montpellier]|uniref:hypothetical protein n=1 Tax=Desulfosarcina variabilis TaxID=2300 RepID=UPI003AFB353F